VASVASVRERSSARSRLRHASANSLRAACCRASAVNSADSRFRCARSVAMLTSCRAPRISEMTAVATPTHFTIRAVVDEEVGSTSRRCGDGMNVTMLAPARACSFGDHTFRFADSELKSMAFREDTTIRVEQRRGTAYRRRAPHGSARQVGSKVAERSSEVIAWKL